MGLMLAVDWNRDTVEEAWPWMVLAARFRHMALLDKCCDAVYEQAAPDGSNLGPAGAAVGRVPRLEMGVSQIASDISICTKPRVHKSTARAKASTVAAATSRRHRPRDGRAS